VTRDASFKKVVRRHAGETGQRYTEALTDLQGLGARMHHEPVPERLLAHLRDRYGIDPVAATKLSVHKTYVFRIDRDDGSPWVARPFPPARPRAGVEGDAAILRFLERQAYPAERLAVDDAVSDFDGSAVLVTRFVEGVQLPDGAAKFAMMGELLGRLHALPYDDSAGRPGGASGEDPSREGTPRQDLLAALSFLDAVDTKVAAGERERFEQLRNRVRSADDGYGLPEGLLHGNLLHAPDHAVLSEQGPVAINWKASGRGPRLADFAYLIWGTGSSTAQSFDIRRRSFCLLVAWEDPAGKPVPLLVLRAGPDEREALLCGGHPFFASRAGRDRIVVLLTDDTDWEEIRELVTESYRILAPRKLTARLD